MGNILLASTSPNATYHETRQDAQILIDNHGGSGVVNRALLSTAPYAKRFVQEYFQLSGQPFQQRSVESILEEENFILEGVAPGLEKPSFEAKQYMTELLSSVDDRKHDILIVASDMVVSSIDKFYKEKFSESRPYGYGGVILSK